MECFEAKWNILCIFFQEAHVHNVSTEGMHVQPPETTSASECTPLDCQESLRSEVVIKDDMRFVSREREGERIFPVPESVPDKSASSGSIELCTGRLITHSEEGRAGSGQTPVPVKPPLLHDESPDREFVSTHGTLHCMNRDAFSPDTLTPAKGYPEECDDPAYQEVSFSDCVEFVDLKVSLHPQDHSRRVSVSKEQSCFQSGAELVPHELHTPPDPYQEDPHDRSSQLCSAERDDPSHNHHATCLQTTSICPLPFYVKLQSSEHLTSSSVPESTASQQMTRAADDTPRPCESHPNSKLSGHDDIKKNMDKLVQQMQRYVHRLQQGITANQKRGQDIHCLQKTIQNNPFHGKFVTAYSF